MLTATLSLVSGLNHVSSALMTSLHSGCRSCVYSQSALFICTKNFCFVFPNHSACRIHETKFLTHVSFLFTFSIHLFTLFPLTLKTFILHMTVAMLSHYQCSVNWKSRNVEGNFMHKVNYFYSCHLPGLEFIQLPKSIEGLLCHVQGNGRISILPTS